MGDFLAACMCLIFLQELVRHVESGHDSDAFQAMNLARVANFTHFVVEIGRGFGEGCLFGFRASYEVFLVEYLDGYCVSAIAQLSAPEPSGD